jgi:hypothetical protein
LPEGAAVYGDKIYTDYKWEYLLKEAWNIALKPFRKTAPNGLSIGRFNTFKES